MLQESTKKKPTESEEILERIWKQKQELEWKKEEELKQLQVKQVKEEVKQTVEPSYDDD